MDAKTLVGRTDGFWRDVGEIPQIKRGKVWCRACGRAAAVDGLNCVKHGWPKCCGSTMTIDSPAEQKRLA